MKITLKKNGLSDEEVCEHLELMLKAMGNGRTEQEMAEEYADSSPNLASKQLLKEYDEHFDKMMHGIYTDVMDIVKDSV